MDFRAIVSWMANTVHQAYHTENGCSWSECPKSVCSAAAKALVDLDHEETNAVEKALKEQRQKIRNLVLQLKESCRRSSTTPQEALLGIYEVLDILDNLE